MEDVSLLSLLVRLAVSMTVVVGLMLLAAKILRRSATGMGITGKGGKTTRTPINVAALQPLTKAAHVAVVRAGGRELVVGVTDHQVTLLHSSIEPRQDLADLDTTLDLDAVKADALADQEGAELTSRTRAGTRTVPSAASTPEQGQAGLSAWTDALEMLRDKTVRR